MILRVFTTIFGLMLCLSLTGQMQEMTEKQAFVQDLMDRMTLADKVGEMTQLSIDVLSVGEPYNLAEPHQLDADRLKRVLVDLRVGSILNVGGHAYSVDRWHEIMDTIQMYAAQKETGIPVIYGIDAIHGTNYTMMATLFPQQIGQAATWNRDLARDCGKVTAYETKASGIPWTFSPVLDMGRDARWPRLWETYGEDVHLAKELSAAYIEGCQGEDIADAESVAVCMKHFLGYSIPWNGRDRTAAFIPERQLREYHLPTFQAAIDQGARTIMINSGEVNGIPVHVNKWILTDLLREELGFTGLAVTDWEDIGYLVSRHRVAADMKEAIAMAINAGIDMAMVPMDTRFPVLLKECVEEGMIDEARIDEATERILGVKYELGLFENTDFYKKGYSKFGGKEHAALAKAAADESIVLLKNEENTLPFSTATKIYIEGPNAESVMALNGGWTGTWQGDDPAYMHPEKMSVSAALKDKMKGAAIVSDPAMAEVIVYVGGESTYTEKPGDIENMALDQSQINRIKELSGIDKPLVFVLLEGRPRIIREVVDDCDAIVLGLLPGNEGGLAIADVVTGAVNPSGKLPITYPSNVNDLLTYDHKWTDVFDKNFGWNGFQPQYHFGHGLSYTDFNYSRMQVQDSADGFTVSCWVSNTGDRSGKEVVQLYVADKVASITPSVKRLRGFEKIELEPGESKQVQFTVTRADLSFVGEDLNWVFEPGDFEVMIADQKAEINLK